jgi:hypothetical protein
VKLVQAPVGARLIDSLPFSRGGTALGAKALATAEVDGVALYLGAATPVQVNACLDAGLGMVGVTFGGAYDGAAAVRQAEALGMPPGWPIFLDLEGPDAFKTPISELTRKVVDWVAPVRAAFFLPCLYVGVPQPFTSEELWKLPVVRYWKGQGLARDRFGNAVEPDVCGWTMTQMWPSQLCGGILVDHNMVGHDYANGGRTLPWAVAD